MSANTTTPRPSPAQWALAGFWAGFHARRTLRRGSSLTGIGAASLLVLALRLAAHLTPAQLTELELTLFLPLFAMFFGTGGLREEVEDQTLTYAFVRPVGRGWLLTARIVAASCATLVPVVLGLVLAGGDAIALLRNLAVAVLGALAYASAFGLLGLLLRQPTLVGLVLLAWEQLAGNVPGFLSRLTLRTHLRALMELQSGGGWFGVSFEAPAWWVSLPTLVGFVAAILVAGAWWVTRRELIVPK